MSANYLSVERKLAYVDNDLLVASVVIELNLVNDDAGLLALVEQLLHVELERIIEDVCNWSLAPHRHVTIKQLFQQQRVVEETHEVSSKSVEHHFVEVRRFARPVLSTKQESK